MCHLRHPPSPARGAASRAATARPGMPRVARILRSFSWFEVGISLLYGRLRGRKDEGVAAEKLVLVVDDHVDERAITRIVLEHYGYEVKTAGTAGEALQVARERRPDLIVMDIMMPDMDGVEAVERLAEDPRTAQIPVVAYTAYRDVYRDRLDRSGFVETLEKPAGPAKLLATVADQIGRPRGRAEEGRT